MSEGGTIQARLEKVTEELNAEMELWQEKQLDPKNWRMGQDELLIRCEVIVFKHIIKEHLGITEDELTLRLREVVLKNLQEMRPIWFEGAEKARSEMIRRGITEGILPQPPPIDPRQNGTPE